MNHLDYCKKCGMVVHNLRRHLERGRCEEQHNDRAYWKLKRKVEK